jgi:peptidyl-prolyl cis-trans isomerase B (cyclophilin B)
VTNSAGGPVPPDRGAQGSDGWPGSGGPEPRLPAGYGRTSSPPGYDPLGAAATGPVRPGGRATAVTAVVAVVAVLLCLGGAVAAAVLVTHQGDADDPRPEVERAASPLVSAGTASPAAPLDCRVSANPGGKPVGPPDFAIAPRTGQATMTIATNLGQLIITMDRAKTPCTVASMQHLAVRHFFDGTSCHRLVSEGIFVLQCGDPVGDSTGGPDYEFADENLTGARYERGVVAMATAGPNRNGSQFFIVWRDCPLQPQYTVFGQVRAGIEIVDRVAAGGSDDAYGQAGGGRPHTTLTLQTVTVG